MGEEHEHHANQAGGRLFRQVNRKAGALPDLTFDGDWPTMHARNPLDNGEFQAAVAFFPLSTSGIHPVKPFKKIREMFWRDVDPSITDDEVGRCVRIAQTHLSLSA